MLCVPPLGKVCGLWEGEVGALAIAEQARGIVVPLFDWLQAIDESLSNLGGPCTAVGDLLHKLLPAEEHDVAVVLDEVLIAQVEHGVDECLRSKRGERDKTRQDKTRQDKTRQDKIRQEW